MKLVIEGFAGAGCITMGGYDYHGGMRREGEQKDERAGKCMGAVLEYETTARARRAELPPNPFTTDGCSMFPDDGWRFSLDDFPATASNAGPMKTVLEWALPKAVLGKTGFLRLRQK